MSKKVKAQSEAMTAAAARLKNAKSDQEKGSARAAIKVIKFRELGSLRVNKTLAAIENLTKLANRNSYTYDEAQVSRIVAALEGAISSLKTRFAASKSGTPAGFSL